MKATLSLALLLAVDGVQVPVPGCKCVMNNLAILPSANGKLLAMPGALDGNMTLVPYPADYGETCAKHLEPGSVDCSYDNGDERPANRSAWCDAPWCHVDPCTCKLADIVEDSYFPGSGLYISYENCGGNTQPLPVSPAAPTDQTHGHGRRMSGVNAVCPGGQFTPTGECSKLDNEAPKFACSQYFAENGMCVEANVSGVKKNYPANYGEGCGIHLEPGDSDCSYPDGTPKPLQEQADWCKMPWSYVNPCECTVADIHECKYFYPRKLYYSYSVCGSPNFGMSTPIPYMNVSTLSASAATKLAVTAGCPSIVPAAVIKSPLNVPRSQATSTKCKCKPMNSTVTMLPVKCNGTNYSQNGMCINTSSIRGLSGLLPANYGSTCGLHAEPLDPGCFDLRSGKPWPAPCRGNRTAGCRQRQCDQPWCFVDPCCKGAEIDGGIQVPGTKVYLAYSYRNCGGNDTIRNASVKPNLTGITCNLRSAAQARGFITAVAAIILSLLA